MPLPNNDPQNVGQMFVQRPTAMDAFRAGRMGAMKNGTIAAGLARVFDNQLNQGVQQNLQDWHYATPHGAPQPTQASGPISFEAGVENGFGGTITAGLARALDNQINQGVNQNLQDWKYAPAPVGPASAPTSSDASVRNDFEGGVRSGFGGTIMSGIAHAVDGQINQGVQQNLQDWHYAPNARQSYQNGAIMGALENTPNGKVANKKGYDVLRAVVSAAAAAPQIPEPNDGIPDALRPVGKRVNTAYGDYIWNGRTWAWQPRK